MRRRFKRRFGKRPSKRNYTTVVVNSAIRPQRMLIKVPYFWSGQLASSVGGLQTYLFNLNSLYDPDRTGTGHQPLGLDQWAGFYSRYRAYRCTYQLTLTNLDPNQSANVAFTASNGVPTYNATSAFEQPQARVAALAPRDGASKVVMYGSIDLARLNGKTHTQYKTDDNTQAVIGSNPVEQLIGAVCAAPTISASELNIGYTIKLTFHAELFDPIILETS